jgi:hypothetical protein
LAVGGLIFAGYLAVIPKNPNDNIVVVRQICGDEIISQYNDAVKGQDFDAMKEVYDDIREKQNYQDDASCVYMALQYTLLAGDAEGSQELFAQLKDLNERHNRISEQIALPMSQADLGLYVEGVSHENEALGSG